jgi:hypothetical protein
MHADPSMLWSGANDSRRLRCAPKHTRQHGRYLTSIAKLNVLLRCVISVMFWWLIP